MSREDLIRAATIVDCEGTIQTYLVRASKLHHTYIPRPQIQVVNSEKWYLEKYLKNLLSIGVINPATSTKKQLWKWSTSYLKAYQVAKILYPFLLIKKRQALEIIEYYENKRTKDGTPWLEFRGLRPKSLNKRFK